jgi:hypothetical protein
MIRLGVGVLILGSIQHEPGSLIDSSHEPQSTAPSGEAFGCTLRLTLSFRGKLMEYKAAAGVFIGGVTMSICGPILATASMYFATWALARGDAGMASVFFAVAALGALLALIGFIMLIVATHRALVKIDALPLQVQSHRTEDWPSRQY